MDAALKKDIAGLQKCFDTTHPGLIDHEEIALINLRLAISQIISHHLYLLLVTDILRANEEEDHIFDFEFDPDYSAMDMTNIEC